MGNSCFLWFSSECSQAIWFVGFGYFIVDFFSIVHLANFLSIIGILYCFLFAFGVLFTILCYIYRILLFCLVFFLSHLWFYYYQADCFYYYVDYPIVFLFIVSCCLVSVVLGLLSIIIDWAIFESSILGFSFSNQVLHTIFVNCLVCIILLPTYLSIL